MITARTSNSMNDLLTDKERSSSGALGSLAGFKTARSSGEVVLSRAQVITTKSKTTRPLLFSLSTRRIQVIKFCSLFPCIYSVCPHVFT